MVKRKVEINGISTNDLPILTAAESRELLESYNRYRNINTRNKLIEGNLKLIMGVLRSSSFAYYDADDLFQVGVLGLVSAINGFDLSKNVDFSTYAVPAIHNTIDRYIKTYNHHRVIRHTKELSRKIGEIKQSFFKVNGRIPTSKELSDILGVKERFIKDTFKSILAVDSIDDNINKSNDMDILLGETIRDSHDEINSSIESSDLKDAFSVLSDRELDIINRLYFLGQYQSEIAEEYKVEQQTISQIHVRAKRKLKNCLENNYRQML